jgi:tyrosyl-tRNA synthetase
MSGETSIRRMETRSGSGFLAELTWRGLIAEMSDGLVARLAPGRPPISGYIGFDASARSLHVGNLVQVFMLTHLQRAGGTPFVVIGGGTGMIGDPSGKSSERNLLDDEQIASNSAAIRAQLGRFVDFSAGPNQAQIVDNREWLEKYSLLEYLREIGKHFSVPYMLAKDSVQQRLAGGLSFTEFSYMTLQAADFLHLYRNRGVELQMGGADQWGNITAGLELIRRVVGRAEGEEAPAYALCSPLLLTRSGVKMGKSEKGAVHLDAALTTPYDFYQYWLNDADELVAQHLAWLTLMTAEEVADLTLRHSVVPEARPMQRALAYDLTARIHGPEEADRQRQLADAVFGGPMGRIVRRFADEKVSTADSAKATVRSVLDDPSVLETLYTQVERFEFDAAPATALELAVASGAFSSRGEARRSIQQGGLSINDVRVAGLDASVPEPIGGRWLVLRVGKKRLVIGRKRG